MLIAAAVLLLPPPPPLLLLPLAARLLVRLLRCCFRRPLVPNTAPGPASCRSLINNTTASQHSASPVPTNLLPYSLCHATQHTPPLPPSALHQERRELPQWRGAHRASFAVVSFEEEAVQARKMAQAVEQVWPG